MTSPFGSSSWGVLKSLRSIVEAPLVPAPCEVHEQSGGGHNATEEGPALPHTRNVLGYSCSCAMQGLLPIRRPPASARRYGPSPPFPGLNRTAGKWDSGHLLPARAEPFTS